MEIFLKYPKGGPLNKKFYFNAFLDELRIQKKNGTGLTPPPYGNFHTFFLNPSLSKYFLRSVIVLTGESKGSNDQFQSLLLLFVKHMREEW